MAPQRSTALLDIDFEPSPIIVAGQFYKFGLDIRSFRVPLERSVRDVLSPTIRQNFEAGGRPPWTPLANLTIEAKARKGAGSPSSPLMLTGQLARVAGQLNFWSVDGPLGQAYISQAKLAGVEYGIYHNFGFTTSKGVTVPAREWALFQPGDADAVENVFWVWLLERVIASGLSGGRRRV
jgi:phage gpG-like protein